MKKIVILFLLALLVISVLIILPNTSITGFSIKDDKNYFDYSWTKAICEGNACRDFEIKCLDRELVEIKPISGFVVFSDNWRDLRNEEERKRLC